MREEKKSSKKIIWPKAVIALAFIFVVGAWYASWQLIDSYVSEESAARGQFGDMFGAVNSLFSGLAFAGVIIAIILQSKELKLQREELEQTREELKGQKDQLALQVESLEKQSFENTFFQMVRLHNEILEKMLTTKYFHPTKGRPIAPKYRDRDIHGRDCFIQYRYKMENYEIWRKFECYELSKIIEAMNNFETEYLKEVGHYFRNLYNIVKYFNDNAIGDPHIYKRIIRAQLSSHELVILFYNCLGERGRKKFKPLVEKWSLLENMDLDLVFNQFHLYYYRIEAYGDQKDEVIKRREEKKKIISGQLGKAGNFIKNNRNQTNEE